MKKAVENFDLGTTGKIKAVFENGREVVYTVAVLHMLLNDPEVAMIINAENGNILFYEEGKKWQ